MKGTGITQQSMPQKPYLWNGHARLLEVNQELMAEREGKPQRAVEPGFCWPLPLPGPPAKAGSGNAEAQKRRRAAARNGSARDGEAEARCA